MSKRGISAFQVEQIRRWKEAVKHDEICHKGQEIIARVREDHGDNVPVDSILTEEERYEEMGMVSAYWQRRNARLAEFHLERTTDGQVRLMEGFEPSMPDEGFGEEEEGGEDDASNSWPLLPPERLRGFRHACQLLCPRKKAQGLEGICWRLRKRQPEFRLREELADELGGATSGAPQDI